MNDAVMLYDFFTDGVHLICHCDVQPAEKPMYERGVMIYPGCSSSVEINDYAIEVDAVIGPIKTGWIQAAQEFAKLAPLTRELLVEAIDPDIYENVCEKIELGDGYG